MRTFKGTTKGVITAQTASGREVIIDLDKISWKKHHGLAPSGAKVESLESATSTDNSIILLRRGVGTDITAYDRDELEVAAEQLFPAAKQYNS